MLKVNDCPLCGLPNTTKVFLLNYDANEKKYVKCMCKNCKLSVIEQVHDDFNEVENIENATELVIKKWNNIGKESGLKTDVRNFLENIIQDIDSIRLNSLSESDTRLGKLNMSIDEYIESKLA